MNDHNDQKRTKAIIFGRIPQEYHPVRETHKVSYRLRGCGCKGVHWEGKAVSNLFYF